MKRIASPMQARFGHQALAASESRRTYSVIGQFSRKQKARCDLARGPVNFSDDVSMQVFCPTSQIRSKCGGQGLRIQVAFAIC
jgi:hypothetical protein